VLVAELDEDDPDELEDELTDWLDELELETDWLDELEETDWLDELDEDTD